MPDRPDELPINDPELVEVLVSPIRQEIVDAAAGLGPFSASELAKVLGRRPDSLYYHLGRLEEAGLLKHVETRETSGRPEVIYALPARYVRLDLKSPRINKGGVISKMVGAMMRLTSRQYAKAVEEEQAQLTGHTRNCYAARITGWLEEDDVALMNHLIEEMNELLSRGRRRRTGRLHALTVALVPIKSEDESDDDEGQSAQDQPLEPDRPQRARPLQR